MPALRHQGSGKVREMYAIDDDRLLLVATDRISAHDRVLPDPIPDKGKVLTGLSKHWFQLLRVPNHMLTTRLEELPLTDEERRSFAGRSMVVRRAEVIPVECVVRGHLYGSAWREYRSGGGPTTEHLPPGLRLADRLDEPIFTPATKAETGHDENLTEGQARDLLGDDLYWELRTRSLQIYLAGADRAARRGIILADTKLEFGFTDGELLVIDEILTPDSSRYWPADRWRPGSEVPSFDKQYVRDWLDGSDWEEDLPPPSLPPDVIEGTRARYVEAFERLTGSKFRDYLANEAA